MPLPISIRRASGCGVNIAGNRVETCSRAEVRSAQECEGSCGEVLEMPAAGRDKPGYGVENRCLGRVSVFRIAAVIAADRRTILRGQREKTQRYLGFRRTQIDAFASNERVAP